MTNPNPIPDTFEPIVVASGKLEPLREASSESQEHSSRPPLPPPPPKKPENDNNNNNQDGHSSSETTPLLPFVLSDNDGNNNNNSNIDNDNINNLKASTSSTWSIDSRRPFGDAHNDAQQHASTQNLRYPSGLDFERVVNHFSIEASRDRYLKPIDEEEHDEHNKKHDKEAQQQQQHTYQMQHPGGVPVAEDAEFAQARYDTLDDGPAKSGGGANKAADKTLPPAPPSEQRKSQPHLWGYTGRTAVGWCFCVMTGLLTSSLAIFLAWQTEMIRDYRSGLLDSLWRDDKRGIYIFLTYAGSNLGLALLSSMLCLYVAPNAVGSGIPEVKAYLNGVRVQRFSSFRLFLVKVLGTILSVSSDLAIGPEGPLVQVGAIMGASCTKLPNFLCSWFPASAFSTEFWKFITMDLSHFSTDKERRILVSIGSAAGFSAAFGAPIGGLLFAVEETSTYFETSMFVKTLATTAIATFLLSVHHGDLSDFSIISLGKFSTPNDNIFLNRIEEIPLYILVAIVGGVMGGLFCKFWVFLQLFRRRFFPSKQAQNRWKLKEVAFVSLLTSSLMYYLPLLPFMRWACRSVVEKDNDSQNESDVFLQYLGHSRRFDCPSGQVNELATIFFGNREDTISDILSDPTDFHPLTLWTTGLVFFFCMTLTLGVALPSGIFMPTFLIGSSMGGAAGLQFQKLLSPEVSPSTFALLGAAALLAGIQRTTVSICVILVEGTGQVKTLIPVILTVMIAKYVGDRISGHGLYELAMEINRFPFLEPGDKKIYDIFPVSEIMSAPPTMLGPREKAHTIVRLLKESVHNGFPVVDTATKRFMGLVRRDQLVALLECGIFEKVDSSEGSQPSPRAQRLKTWQGPTGWGSSPNMYLAYHIKPDRYAHVEDNTGGKSMLSPNSSASSAETPLSNISFDKPAENLGRSDSAGETASNRILDNDEYDNNAWLLATRHAREQLEAQPGGLASNVITRNEDSMPLPSTRRFPKISIRKSSFTLATTPSLHKRNAATVGLNQRGNVYIKWLDPAYEQDLVPVGDVMNLGTYSVHEHTPVSKAYTLFTALGLRHLVVLGGESGGEVVGILTRINFLSEFISERTGCEHIGDH